GPGTAGAAWAWAADAPVGTASPTTSAAAPHARNASRTGTSPAVVIPILRWGRVRRSPRQVPLDAGLRRDGRAGGRPARSRGRRRPVRGAGAPRHRPPLGPAPGARRRARVVGR